MISPVAMRERDDLEPRIPRSTIFQPANLSSMVSLESEEENNSMTWSYQGFCGEFGS